MRLHDTIRTGYPAPNEGGLRSRLGRAAIPLACACVMAYFAYHGVEGQHGLNRLLELRDTRTGLEQHLTATRKVRDRLEHDVALLRTESLDPDLLEERARAVLGYTHPDEITIFVDE